MVRERVKTFARYSDRREGVPFRLIILDEADEMCLDPETKVIVGQLDNLKQLSLRELYAEYGEQPFDLPTLDTMTRRPENDKGRIVPSGSADLYRVMLEDGRSILASAGHNTCRSHQDKRPATGCRSCRLQREVPYVLQLQAQVLQAVSDHALRAIFLLPTVQKPLLRPAIWAALTRAERRDSGDGPCRSQAAGSATKQGISQKEVRDRDQTGRPRENTRSP